MRIEKKPSQLSVADRSIRSKVLAIIQKNLRMNGGIIEDFTRIRIANDIELELKIKIPISTIVRWRTTQDIINSAIKWRKK